MSADELINQTLDLLISVQDYQRGLKDNIDKREMDYAIVDCRNIIKTIGKVNGWLEHREKVKAKELSRK